ncbi:MAG: 5'/3'-nucleotidase SurE [Bdellovibrionales bacterium]|nr:5'/3'-nucleotidase SurE [Bdellovibrionales bacterium]
MKLLLANDDGVLAPGIRALYQELKSSFDTTIVAPLEERSTTGHSLSLDKPLRVEKLEENVFGCSGFPGDCVLMGLHLMKAHRPDVVISGINRGANLGQDLYYSGTIAAAREASFHKIPALAVSLVINSVTEEHRYHTAAQVIRLCLENEIHQHIPPLTLININVPNLELSQIKGYRLTEIGFRRYSEEIHARIDMRQKEYFWIAGLYEGHAENPESDCQAVHEGYVSITPHALVDRTSKEYSGLIKVIERLNATIAP